MTVAIVYPVGVGPEEEDTLIQANAIIQVLEADAHPYVMVPCHGHLADLATRLRQLNPTRIINLMESFAGQDESFWLPAALFEALGIPYSGCSAGVLAQLADKMQVKVLLDAVGFPVLPTYTKTTLPDGDQRWIVKSASLHASVGLDDENVVSGKAAALACLATKTARHGGEWFIEPYITGREIHVAALPLPDGSVEFPHVAEMLFRDYPDDKPRIFGYAAKWLPETFAFQQIGRCFDFTATDAALIAHLQEMTARLSRTLGIDGLFRIDFRIDDSGNAWILDLNCNPCFAPGGGLIEGFQHTGASWPDFLRRALGL